MGVDTDVVVASDVTADVFSDVGAGVACPCVGVFCISEVDVELAETEAEAVPV